MGGAAPKSVAITQLRADEWLSIGQQLEFDPLALCALAATCREARDATATVMRGAKLTALKSKMNQSEVRVVFGLTVARAKALPHAIETDYYRGTPLNYLTYPMRVFNAERVLASLLADGGWRAVSALLAKIASKKRKRDYLEDRRAAALAGRRATLDAWFDKERPAGADVASVDAWIESLGARGLHESTYMIMYGSYAWVRFLDKTLAAPSLVKVKESVKEHEAVAVISGKIHAEKAARKKALTAALEARGVVCGVDPRVPSCEFVVSGTIDGVATTADEVADGEAKRLWDLGSAQVSRGLGVGRGGAPPTQVGLGC